MRRLVRFGMRAACAGITLCGATAHAANLGAIYALALAHDAQYAAAVETAAAGREKSEQGRALLRPTLGVNGNARHNSDSSSSYAGSASYNSGNIALNASQPLLRLGNYAAYQQGELQAQLADQQLELARQDLLVRVSRGYFDVLQAQDALTTVRGQRDAFTGQLAQARRSFEVGLAPVTDVNEAQSRYDLTLAQEIAASNELEVKRRALEKAIGRELPVLATLDADANIDILDDGVLEELSSTAPRRAWPVAIGATSEEIARQEIARQQAGHMPTVDMVASLGENRNGNYSQVGKQRTSSASIGIELNIPLYEGGATSSRVREAAHNLGRAQGDLDNARRQAILDARQALLGVRSGVALDKALRKAVTSGETQVRSTRRGLEVGLRTRVDVLNAEQQLYTTQRDLSAARYQTLNAGLLLRAAAGGLREDDLRALDALLKE
jgi:outer membrane protein